MPQKNEIIYEDVYCDCVLQYGLWDEIRVDHGRECYLTLYVQEQLRGDTQIAPYVQTSSAHNHIIERVWVEVNQRVTYSIKRIIVEMDDQHVINMESDTERSCISYILSSSSIHQQQRFGHKVLHQLYTNHTKHKSRSIT